jgi:uncharacterized protein
MNARHLFRITHRDMGFAVSGLLLIYCISGLALNHINEWNPDFILVKRTVPLPPVHASDKLTDSDIASLNAAVGEARCKLYESPSPGKIKLYYENASLLADLARKTGQYERIQRRPLFYHVNVLHRNTLDAWRWMADLFAIVLILITVTGIFMQGGRQGLAGRGKWYLLAGCVPPAVALVFFAWAAQ